MTYKILIFCITLVSRIPFRVLYLISDCLGAILYHVVRYRRKVVRRNLTECFPEKNIRKVKRIERKFYRFFTDNILESVKMATITPQEMSRRMRFPNMEEVNDVLRGGRSVGLYLGHYGNWEWISSMPLHLYPGAVPAQIYHKLNSETFDRLMLHLRGRMGAVNVEMHKTARWITSQVSAGHECIVGFIADQSPRYFEINYSLPFLNHMTPVYTGTEKIVKHYGFDAWFVSANRVRRGYYEVEFVRMSEDPDSLPDFKLTDIYYRMLEEMIRRQPELYLWTHKRFRNAQLMN